MKRAANETADKTQNIMSANLDGLGEEALARMPNEETLRRDIGRNRKLNDVVVLDARDYMFHIPPLYTVNNLGNPFLQYDNNHEDRVLIFGTRQSLDFLSNSPNWFMDGTFKVSPPQFRTWIKCWKTCGWGICSTPQQTVRNISRDAASTFNECCYAGQHDDIF